MVLAGLFSVLQALQPALLLLGHPCALLFPELAPPHSFLLLEPLELLGDLQLPEVLLVCLRGGTGWCGDWYGDWCGD